MSSNIRTGRYISQATPRASATWLGTGATATVPKSKARTMGVLTIGIGLAVAVAVALLWLYKLVSSKKPLVSLETTKLSRLTVSGKVRTAAISPDGKYVVYAVGEDAGQQSLWMRQVATMSNVQIVPPTEGRYGDITFTRDGDYIYYTKYDKENPNGVLYQSPVLGGATKKLLERIDSAVALSPDNKRIAFIRGDLSQQESTLMVASVDGTGERRLAVRKPPRTFGGSPAWSPDGRIIACPGDGGASDMTLIGVGEDGSERPLTSRKWFGISRTAWLPDESGLVLAAWEKTSGTSQIWLLSYPEGDVQRITNDFDDYGGLALTGDGSSIASVQNDTVSNIWVVPRNTGSHGKQITAGKRDGDWGLDWTADGKIIYVSSAGGNLNIWSTDQAGTSPRQLTSDFRTNVQPAVSPDNKSIVFTSVRKGVPHLFRMDIDGGNVKQLTDGSGEGLAAYSSDSRSVVYIDMASQTIWRISSQGGKPVQVTKKESLPPSVSPDGKSIACGYRPDPKKPMKLAAIPITGEPPTRIFDVPPTAELYLGPGWRPDGRALTYIDTRNGVSNIWAVPLAGGPAKPLTDFDSGLIFGFVWSRDGKRLALARGRSDSDVVLISGFTQKR